MYLKDAVYKIHVSQRNSIERKNTNNAFIQNSKMNIFDTSGQCTVSP